MKSLMYSLIISIALVAGLKYSISNIPLEGEDIVIGNHREVIANVKNVVIAYHIDSPEDKYIIIKDKVWELKEPYYKPLWVDEFLIDLNIDADTSADLNF